MKPKKLTCSLSYVASDDYQSNNAPSQTLYLQIDRVDDKDEISLLNFPIMRAIYYEIDNMREIFSNGIHSCDLVKTDGQYFIKYPLSTNGKSPDNPISLNDKQPVLYTTSDKMNFTKFVHLAKNMSIKSDDAQHPSEMPISPRFPNTLSKSRIFDLLSGLRLSHTHLYVKIERPHAIIRKALSNRLEINGSTFSLENCLGTSRIITSRNIRVSIKEFYEYFFSADSIFESNNNLDRLKDDNSYVFEKLIDVPKSNWFVDGDNRNILDILDEKIPLHVLEIATVIKRCIDLTCGQNDDDQGPDDATINAAATATEFIEHIIAGQTGDFLNTSAKANEIIRDIFSAHEAYIDQKKLPPKEEMLLRYDKEAVVTDMFNLIKIHSKKHDFLKRHSTGKLVFSDWFGIDKDKNKISP